MKARRFWFDNTSHAKQFLGRMNRSLLSSPWVRRGGLLVTCAFAYEFQALHADESRLFTDINPHRDEAGHVEQWCAIPPNDPQVLVQIRLIFIEAFTQQYAHLHAEKDLGLTAEKLNVSKAQFASMTCAQKIRQFVANAIEDEIEDWRNNDYTEFLLRYNAKGEVIALVSVDTSSDKIYISQLAVSPEYQRQGIGTSLIESVRQRYQDRETTLLYRTNNPSIDQFYLSLGFTRSNEQNMHGKYSSQYYVEQQAPAYNHGLSLG